MQQEMLEDWIHAMEYINDFEEKVIKIMSS